MNQDNYVITERTIKEPPKNFFQKLKFLGPGFILSASIVGSGELIATTALGAKAGYVAFWIILVSCLIKVAIQLEFGKHAILTGETVMSAFNRLPGPRAGKGNWAVWTVLFLSLFKAVQFGGMVGGSAVVLFMLFPAVPLMAWVVAIISLVAILIHRGFYKVVEKISLAMIVTFTVSTITAVLALRYTAFSFTFSDIAGGLQFRFPPEIVTVAFGAFGITGVASDEIIAYNYWCIEKGYAAYAGPADGTAAWKKRAQGWINVMYLDAIFAMVIYTCVTAAFYILGAAILHGRSDLPQGNAIIETLALIYTESLGAGARTVYLVGAFFVLFSSVFAGLAAFTRMYSDIAGQMGWINFFNLVERKRLVSWLAWVIPVVWAILYLFIQLPVAMIITGGISGSLLLFVVVYAGVRLRKERVKTWPSGAGYNLAFSLSVISIVSVGVYGLISILS
jgi:manganese transport protein